MPEKPSSLNSLLNALFKQKNWEKKLRLNQLFRFWDQVMGPEIAAQAQPVVIRGTTLWLRVRDPIWIQQLHLQKLLLLEKLNQHLDGPRLDDIRFQIETAQTRKSPPPPRQRPKAKKELDPQVKKQGEQLVDGLKSDEIRTGLLRLWEKMHQEGR